MTNPRLSEMQAICLRILAARGITANIPAKSVPALERRGLIEPLGAFDRYRLTAAGWAEYHRREALRRP
jgi:hypothetical protein